MEHSLCKWRTNYLRQEILLGICRVPFTVIYLISLELN